MQSYFLQQSTISPELLILLLEKLLTKLFNGKQYKISFFLCQDINRYTIVNASIINNLSKLPIELLLA